ncbi:uncharacterized protein LOC129306179 isoform X2 [Prosopis cineraria]|uniref:uncharacterized protein LOC129306179 isoform X2 n=1 Tax=Prosopis cineraria TaxID=364024 RepID=UPI00240F6DE9|nr:uncharacterized protein LOC129306179 isoform X2 [Prosopis cineraria]
MVGSSSKVVLYSRTLLLLEPPMSVIVLLNLSSLYPKGGNYLAKDVNVTVKQTIALTASHFNILRSFLTSYKRQCSCNLFQGSMSPFLAHRTYLKSSANGDEVGEDLVGIMKGMVKEWA